MDPCHLDPKKCSSQLFEARQKRMTAILNLKNWFTAIWSLEKVVHNSLEQEKRITAIYLYPQKLDLSYLEYENNGSKLFRERKYWVISI